MERAEQLLHLPVGRNFTGGCYATDIFITLVSLAVLPKVQMANPTFDHNPPYWPYNPSWLFLAFCPLFTDSFNF